MPLRPLPLLLAPFLLLLALYILETLSTHVAGGTAPGGSMATSVMLTVGACSARIRGA